MRRRTLFLLALPGLAGCRKPAANRLNVFNWSNYVAPDTIERFTRETGIHVRYSVYESNEEMLARVLSGNSGWDVVFPTNYYIGPMRAMNLLAPLDSAHLTNSAALDSLFARPSWDPGLEWCMPYMWGSSGILADGRITPLEVHLHRLRHQPARACEAARPRRRRPDRRLRHRSPGCRCCHEATPSRPNRCRPIRREPTVGDAMKSRIYRP